MGLENTLKALELSIKNRLLELDESLLQDKEVRNTLITHFSEQQTRPEIVSQIRAHSLMYEYFNLSLDEREELELFRQNHPEYIGGKGNDFHNSPFKSEKTNILAKKQRYVNQILTLFDFYLEKREENEVFNANYLIINNRLKKQFGNLGKKLFQNVRNNLKEEGGLDKIIELASEINPEIKKYTTSGEVLKIDGPKQVLRIFDFYLEKREENEVFNANYLKINNRLKKQFGNLGKNLCQNVSYNLKEEGGLDKIIELASEINPEIKKYRTFKEILKVDGIKQLLRVFDFYLENREENEVFNANYLKINNRLKKQFGNLGKKLYDNVSRNLKEEGGISYIIQLAAKQRPEILTNWQYHEQVRIR